MSTPKNRPLASTPDRDMNIAIALQLLGKDVAQAVTNAMVTCLACEHFNEPTELCALARQRPPARVIAHGCPEFKPHIPF